MQDINIVTLSGGLVRKNLSTINNGATNVLNFTIAVNESYKSGDEWKEATNYVYCQLYGPQATWLDKNLELGTLLFVDGKLKVRSWKDGGEWKTQWNIVCRNLRFQMRNQNRTSESMPTQEPVFKTGELDGEFNYNINEDDVPF